MILTHNKVHCARVTHGYRSSRRRHQSDPWSPRYAHPPGYGGALIGVVNKRIYDTVHIFAHGASIGTQHRTLCSNYWQLSFTLP